MANKDEDRDLSEELANKELPTWIKDFLELPVGSQASTLLGVVAVAFLLKFAGTKLLLGVEAAAIGSVVATEQLLLALLLQSAKILGLVLAIGLLFANLYWFTQRSDK
eukprot:1065719-Pyramimonas_sp.AAC.1